MVQFGRSENDSIENLISKVQKHTEIEISCEEFVLINKQKKM